jgi:hypothetical protein
MSKKIPPPNFFFFFFSTSIFLRLSRDASVYNSIYLVCELQFCVWFLRDGIVDSAVRLQGAGLINSALQSSIRASAVRFERGLRLLTRRIPFPPYAYRSSGSLSLFVSFGP